MEYWSGLVGSCAMLVSKSQPPKVADPRIPISEVIWKEYAPVAELKVMVYSPAVGTAMSGPPWVPVPNGKAESPQLMSHPSSWRNLHAPSFRLATRVHLVRSAASCVMSTSASQLPRGDAVPIKPMDWLNPERSRLEKSKEKSNRNFILVEF